MQELFETKNYLKIKKIWYIMLIFITIWGCLLSVNAEMFSIRWKIFIVVSFLGISSVFFFLCGCLSGPIVQEKEVLKRYLCIGLRLYIYIVVFINILRILGGNELTFPLLNAYGPASWILALEGCLILTWRLRNKKTWLILIPAIIFATFCFKIPVFADYTVIHEIFCFFPIFFIGNRINIDIVNNKEKSSLIFAGVSFVCIILVLVLSVRLDIKQRVSDIEYLYSLYNYPSFGILFYVLSGLIGICFLFFLMIFVRIKKTQYTIKYQKWPQIIFLFLIINYTISYYVSIHSVFLKFPLSFFLGVAGITIVLFSIINRLPWRIIGGNWIENNLIFRITQFKNVLNDKWNKKSGRKKAFYYITLYTISFSFIAFGVFLTFIQTNKSMLWYPDGIAGYYGNLIYLRSAILDFWDNICSGNMIGYSSYDFSISLGRDVAQRFISTIFQPVQLLACLCPYEQIENLFVIGVIFRYYITGLAFSKFAYYYKKNLFPLLLGSFIYTFCGFAVFAGVRHPFLQGAMAVFPLLLLGVEKILNKEKPFLLIGIVFVGSACSIYTFYFMSICAFIYALIRFFYISGEKSWKIFLRHFGVCIGCYLLGMTMSAVTWIPTMFTYKASGRIGNVEKLDLSRLISYGKDYYDGILNFFVSGKLTVGSWTCLGFSVIVIPSLIYFFVKKNKQQKWLCSFFVVLTICLCIPVFGFMTSGFNNIFNRWCFAYALCVAIIVMYFMSEIEYVNQNQLKKIAAIVMGYIVLLFLFNDFEVELRILYSIIILSIILVCILMFYIMKSEEHRFCLKIICYLCAFLSIIVNANFVYGRSGDNYANEFIEKNTAFGLFSDSALGSLSEYLNEIEDDTFYRVESNNVTLLTDNSGKLFGVNGLSDFNSAESIYNNYLIETENSGIYDTTVRLGMDSRVMQLALASVKYYACDDSRREHPPYGYKLVNIRKRENSESMDYLFENKYPLPLGYTYDSYISREEYESLSAIEKQEALLQSILLEKKSNHIKEGDIDYSSQMHTINYIEYNNVVWDNGILYVENGGGSITLFFEDTVPNSELYLRLKGYGMGIDNHNQTWKISVHADGVDTKTVLTSSDNPYTTASDGRLVNLGYYNNSITEITVDFETPGSYRLEVSDSESAYGSL